MNSIRCLRLIFVLAFMLLLCACAAPAGETPAQPTQPPASDTPQPTAPPTATDLPGATPTPEPTPTPTATPAPVLPPSQPLSPDNIAVLQEFSQLGLGQVLTAAWSPDGETLALGTGAGMRLLDGHTLDLILFIESGYTYRLAWSPDGSMLAAGYDESVPLSAWDAASGENLFSKPYTHGRIEAMAFDAEGVLLVAGNQATDPSDINNYKITTYLDSYNPWDGALLNSLPLLNPKNKMLPLFPFYSADGGLVQTMGYNPDGNADMVWWNARNGKALYTQSVNAGSAVLPLPTFGNYAVLRDRKTADVLQVIDLTSGQSAELGLEAKAQRVEFSAQGILAVFIKGAVIFYDPQTLQETARLVISENIQPGYFSPDYTRSAYPDGDILTLEGAADGALLGSLRGFYPMMRSPLLSADGNTLLTFSGNSAQREAHFRLWDMLTLEPLYEQPASQYADAEMLALALPSGEFLVGKEGYSGATLYDARSGAAVGEAHLSEENLYTLALSGDGRVLMFNYMMFNYNFYNMENMEPLGAVPDIYGSPISWASALSADGSRAMFKDEDYLLVWDVQAGAEIFHLLEEMVQPAFSPLGNRLAFGSKGDAPVVQLYDVDSGQRVAQQALKGYVLTMAFSPDGSLLLVSANNDGLYFFDAATGEMLHKLGGYDPNGLTFSATGDLLIATASDGTIRFWGVPGGD